MRLIFIVTDLQFVINFMLLPVVVNLTHRSNVSIFVNDATLKLHRNFHYFHKWSHHSRFWHFKPAFRLSSLSNLSSWWEKMAFQFNIWKTCDLIRECLKISRISLVNCSFRIIIKSRKNSASISVAINANNLIFHS